MVTNYDTVCFYLCKFYIMILLCQNLSVATRGQTVDVECWFVQSQYRIIPKTHTHTLSGEGGREAGGGGGRTLAPSADKPSLTSADYSHPHVPVALEQSHSPLRGSQ